MKEAPKDTGYLVTLDLIQQRTDISALEKDVIALVARRQGAEKNTGPFGYTEMAKQAGASVRQLKRAVKNLRTKHKDLLKVYIKRKRMENGEYRQFDNQYSCPLLTGRAANKQKRIEHKERVRGVIKMPVPNLVS